MEARRHATETVERGATPAELARRTWAAGDYSAIAEAFIPDLGRRLVEYAGIAAGERVLDVAAGAGNAAIPAAARGARVTALDIVPELVEHGRRRAEAAGLDLDWVVGDAAALPFDDGSFDVVMSCVGVQFVPLQQQAARELARMIAPGGRLALLNWTPDSYVGRTMTTVGRHLPPPPGASPPQTWGDEKRLRELFEPEGLSLRFQPGTTDFRRPGAAEFVDFTADRYGPVRAAREQLEAQGAWGPLHAALLALAETSNQADRAFHVDCEYVVALGERS